MAATCYSTPRGASSNVCGDLKNGPPGPPCCRGAGAARVFRRRGEFGVGWMFTLGRQCWCWPLASPLDSIPHPPPAAGRLLGTRISPCGGTQRHVGVPAHSRAAAPPPLVAAGAPAAGAVGPDPAATSVGPRRQSQSQPPRRSRQRAPVPGADPRLLAAPATFPSPPDQCAPAVCRARFQRLLLWSRRPAAASLPHQIGWPLGRSGNRGVLHHGIAAGASLAAMEEPPLTLRIPDGRFPPR